MRKKNGCLEGGAGPIGQRGAEAVESDYQGSGAWCTQSSSPTHDNENLGYKW